MAWEVCALYFYQFLCFDFIRFLTFFLLKTLLVCRVVLCFFLTGDIWPILINLFLEREKLCLSDKVLRKSCIRRVFYYTDFFPISEH